MQNCKRNVLVLMFFFILSGVCSFQAFSVSSSKAKQQRLEFINYAKRFVGCPYVRGAIGPDSFDCSGLIFTCSRESIKVQLPRKTEAIFKFCKEIKDKDLEAGDLVFFKTTGDGTVSHVGIYMGNNQFIHCASDGPNTGVIVSSLKENYWKTHYFKAGRFLPASKSEELATISAEKLFELEASFFFDWNFFTAKNVDYVFRGLDARVGVRFSKFIIQPFAAADIIWDYAIEVVQLPTVIGVAFTPYFRVYGGTVLTFGNPQPASKKFGYDDEPSIEAKVLPGIFGVELQAPRIKFPAFDVTFVQDVHYILYERADGKSLNFKQRTGNGIVFATGLRAIF